MRSLKKTLLLLFQILIIQLLFASVLYSKEKTSNELQPLINEIERIRIETNTPAVGIAIVNADGCLWVGSLGSRDLDPLNTTDKDTLFRIGSISKMFVSLSLLKLQEEEKLNLNDTLESLIPEIPYENRWSDSNPLRIVHLLEHTTGWDDMTLAASAFEDTSMSLKDALQKNLSKRKSRWVPGTRYCYSNSGYAVAAYIVEKVAGIPFEQYVQGNFFEPLRMESTSYRQTEKFLKNGTTSYLRGKKQDYRHLIYPPVGAINTSPKDFANFICFMLKRGEFFDKRIISESSIDRMESSQSSLNAQAGIEYTYGLGNRVSGFSQNGTILRGHDGSINGNNAVFEYIPELGVGYAVFVNSSPKGLYRMSSAIKRHLFKDETKAKIERYPLPDELRSIVGYYRPINIRFETSRIKKEIDQIIKVDVSIDHILRKKLFSNSTNKDFCNSKNELVQERLGLIFTAVVDDPLQGEVLAIGKDLYKKVSPFSFVPPLFSLIFTPLLSIVSLVGSMLWLCQRCFKKSIICSPLLFQLWPTLATFCLIFMFYLLLSPINSTKELGLLTPRSLCIYLLSVAYPLITILSIVACYLANRLNRNKRIYESMIVLNSLHLFNIGYLAYYGYIGIQFWK